MDVRRAEMMAGRFVAALCAVGTCSIATNLITAARRIVRYWKTRATRSATLAGGTRLIRVGNTCAIRARAAVATSRAIVLRHTITVRVEFLTFRATTIIALAVACLVHPLACLTTADEIRATGRVGWRCDALTGVLVAHLTGITLLRLAGCVGIVRVKDLARLALLDATEEAERATVTILIFSATDGIERTGAGMCARRANALAIATDFGAGAFALTGAVDAFLARAALVVTSTTVIRIGTQIQTLLMAARILCSKAATGVVLTLLAE